MIVLSIKYDFICLSHFRESSILEIDVACYLKRPCFKGLGLVKGWSRYMKIKALFHYYLGASLFFSGVASWHAKLHELSMRQLQRAAQADIEKALLLIGQLLKYKGLTPYNKIVGVGYLKTLADKDHAQGCFMLAEAYQDPELIIEKIDASQLVALYEKAAQQGHIMAALRLSRAYEQGLYELTVDSEKAEYWHEKFFEASNL